MRRAPEARSHRHTRTLSRGDTPHAQTAPRPPRRTTVTRLHGSEESKRLSFLGPLGRSMETVTLSASPTPSQSGCGAGGGGRPRTRSLSQPTGAPRARLAGVRRRSQSQGPHRKFQRMWNFTGFFKHFIHYKPDLTSTQEVAESGMKGGHGFRPAPYKPPHPTRPLRPTSPRAQLPTSPPRPRLRPVPRKPPAPAPGTPQAPALALTCRPRHTSRCGACDGPAAPAAAARRWPGCRTPGPARGA